MDVLLASFVHLLDGSLAERADAAPDALGVRTKLSSKLSTALLGHQRRATFGAGIGLIFPPALIDRLLRIALDGNDAMLRLLALRLLVSALESFKGCLTTFDGSTITHRVARAWATRTDPPPPRAEVPRRGSSRRDPAPSVEDPRADLVVLSGMLARVMALCIEKSDASGCEVLARAAIGLRRVAGGAEEVTLAAQAVADAVLEAIAVRAPLIASGAVRKHLVAPAADGAVPHPWTSTTIPADASPTDGRAPWFGAWKAAMKDAVCRRRCAAALTDEEEQSMAEAVAKALHPQIKPGRRDALAEAVTVIRGGVSASI